MKVTFFTLFFLLIDDFLLAVNRSCTLHENTLFYYLTVTIAEKYIVLKCKF